MRRDRHIYKDVFWLHESIFSGLGKTLEPIEPEALTGNGAQEGEEAKKGITASCERSILW